MISVTRLNDRPIVVNAEQIRSVEANPDSTITMVNGDHIIVKETLEEIVAKVVEYGQTLRRVLPPS